MTRRSMFHAADLARMLKVVKACGYTIRRVQIDPDGAFTVDVETTPPDDQAAVTAALEALRARVAEKRRLRSEAEKLGLPKPKSTRRT